MNKIQLEEVREVQKVWSGNGIAYEDIIIHNNIVYMLLYNGTAFSINEQGKGNWVTTGWEDGKSIVERPSGRLLLEVK